MSPLPSKFGYFEVVLRMIALSAVLAFCVQGCSRKGFDEPAQPTRLIVCEGIDCSGHGVCVSDHRDSTPHCICDPGYEAELTECRPTFAYGGPCTSDLDCVDTDPCTTTYCSDALYCRTVLNTAQCNDGDACTESDQCSEGFCSGTLIDNDNDGHAPLTCVGGDDCDDTNASVNPLYFEGPLGAVACGDGLDNDCDGAIDAADATCVPCVNDVDCSDANLCNGIETCKAQLCVGGTSLTCDDSDICTNDACVAMQGCVYEATGNCTTTTSPTTAAWPATTCNGNGWCWSYPGPAGGQLNAIWGVAADDVWVVGEAGMAFHFDGSTWQQIPTGVSYPLHAIHGIASDDFWVGPGTGDPFLHYDGSTFTQVPTNGIDVASIDAIAVTAPNSAWASYTGTFTLQGTGGLLRWDGTQWQQYSAGNTRYLDLWAPSIERVWAPAATSRPMMSSVYSMKTWDGFAWTTFPGDGSVSYAVHGVSEADFWLFGRNEAIHVTGLALSTEAVYTGTPVVLVDAHFVEPEHGWAVGASGTIRLWNGVSWVGQQSSTASSLTKIWASSVNDAWALGTAATIVHWNGTDWNSNQTASSTATLRCIWGSADDDIWAAGDGGLVLRYDGTGWTEQPVDTSSAINSMWGSGANDIWFVGDDGLALHYDGTQLNTLASFATRDLLAVDGAAPGEVWAVDAQSKVWRLHASAVSQLETDLSPHTLTDIEVVSPSEIWVTAHYGADFYVYEYNGNRWTEDVIPEVDRVGVVAGSRAAGLWVAGAVNNNLIFIKLNGNGWDVVSGLPTTSLCVNMTMVGAEPVCTHRDGSLSTGAAAGWRLEMVYEGHSLRDFWQSPNGTRWTVGDGAAILYQ